MATQALRNAAAAEGSVRVIVGVRSPAAPEGGLSEAARGDQRSRIAAAQSSVIGRIGEAAVVNRFETVPFVTMTVTPAELEALLADPEVTSVTVDGLSQPHMDTSTGLIGARRLWRAGINGTDTSVAVLDTGITFRHRAFNDAHAAAACFSSNYAAGGVTSLCRGEREVHIAPLAARECDTSFYGCGHGTHTSSTVMGRAPRAYRGVAPQGQLIPIQVFSHSPQSACERFGIYSDCVLSYDSDQIEALEYVARIASQHNIVAVNMSLGGNYFREDCDSSANPAYVQAVANLVSMGVAVIASSGNNGYNLGIGFPACLSNVIAVGATDDNDNIANFSNQAPGMVDLMAPGVGIRAAAAGTRRGTVSFSGTSMAAPHVAGAFALLRDAVPNATVAQILEALQCTGVTVSRPTVGDEYTRINVFAARRQLVRGGHPGCS
ncbi:S8 family serine peptidase [Cereibacter sphaeroides]|nr:S8 family serine peptidase [Cereibacter sphaeroides]